jgi:hypothetical protein
MTDSERIEIAARKLASVNELLKKARRERDDRKARLLSDEAQGLVEGLISFLGSRRSQD